MAIYTFNSGANSIQFAINDESQYLPKNTYGLMFNSLSDQILILHDLTKKGYPTIHINLAVDTVNVDGTSSWANAQALADALESLFFLASSGSSFKSTGTLFEDNFDGTSLDGNWEVSGPITTSVGGGFLNMQNTAGASFTTYVRRTDKTYFTNNFKAEIEYFLRQTNGSDFGMSVAFKHPTGRALDFRFSHNDGFLKILFNNAGASAVSSSQTRVPSIGDKIKIEVVLRENKVIGRLYINDVFQFSLKYEYIINLTVAESGQPAPQPNRITPTIGIFNCPEVDVNFIKYTDLNKANPQLCFFGDSYTQGFDALTLDKVWTSKVQDYFNINASKYAGAGNLTDDLINGIEQVTSNKPKNVILFIGVNDVNNSVPIGTIQTNITNIVNQLQSAGIKVFVCTPVLFTANAPLNDWVRTTYPNQLIDTTGFLAGGGTSNTGSETLISTSTHPNELANDMIAEGVIEYIQANNLL